MFACTRERFPYHESFTYNLKHTDPRGPSRDWRELRAADGNARGTALKSEYYALLLPGSVPVGVLRQNMFLN